MGVACERPGCGGTIEDGFCDRCGLAPEGAPSAVITASSAHAQLSAARTTRSTRSTGATTTKRRSSGVALSALPPPAPRDPMAALVPGEVPERRRFCSSCDAKLTRASGFCPKCGQPFSFDPSLVAGQMVAGKYEVKGTIAFGGLGWIYLAMDTVLNRWIVLKGLLNSQDPNLVRAAVQEREFLAAVKHRNIVAIYDFITEGGEGFIVMEYVNGRSLLQARREHGGPLPALDACAYILEILPAFSYLHQEGLVYCDFKIDNAILEGDAVKLIDLGAVRRQDDPGGDIYGTRGYAAPEADTNPTPSSDLYTVGRSLAVLVTDFDFQDQFVYTIPGPESAAVFRQYPSLHRLLEKATRVDPEARFQTADELAAQLQGVLRDVAAGTGVLAPVESAVFETETGRELIADFDSVTSDQFSRSRSLPAIRPAPADPAAGLITAAASIPDAHRRLALLEVAWRAHPDSLELPFRLAGALTESGAPEAEMEAWLDRAGVVGRGDWRAMWYRGQAALARGDAGAKQAFEMVMAELPGELAPKLAYAYALEQAGDLDSAEAYFDLVSSADASYTSAAFGLARCRRRKGDHSGAATALERVPSTSSRYESARMAMAQVLIEAGSLERAAEVLSELSGALDTIPLHRLTARLLVAAAAAAGTNGLPDDTNVLGIPARVRALRFGAERELRACARLAPTRRERISYIDEANRARPLTVL